MIAGLPFHQPLIECKPPFEFVGRIKLPRQTDPIHEMVGFNRDFAVFPKGKHGLIVVNLADASVQWEEKNILHMGESTEYGEGTSRTYIMDDKLWVLTLYNECSVYDLRTGEKLNEFPSKSNELIGRFGDLVYSHGEIFNIKEMKIISSAENVYGSGILGVNDHVTWYRGRRDKNVYYRESGESVEFIEKDEDLLNQRRVSFYSAGHYLLAKARDFYKCFDMNTKISMWSVELERGKNYRHFGENFSFIIKEEGFTYTLEICNNDTFEIVEEVEFDSPFCHCDDKWVYFADEAYNIETKERFDISEAVDWELRSAKSRYVFSIYGKFMMLCEEGTIFDIYRGTGL